ncbi:dolichyl-phosphate-mannose--protein mannosyltransferase [Ktedonobacter sp. SOSP1-85]|uniref:ArnT family glycosyltransferase n=1 Tax=Ktedonobacter sp. SOSP1-85 TaxID=2778367 RepID=UPI0019162706|nr:glycosyltransferase family 39 protein [Ktedonobacter sp. SOSP1-85]GHO80734.1 dolichyl-phosphate-mannose--protein mannosyltransferase [Ktedonobacter sp. SOSP1-85]
MADTTEIVARPPSEDDAVHKIQPQSFTWSRIALGTIMLISIFMNFFQLGANGFGNLYYAAGVKSMGDSLHNFFFVSFDPGGFVTIDKPPLGFWLQVISTKIFGFTSFALLFPQALAGVLSVAILYWLVRRHFGVVAGLLAALALAISPISVVTNRNNTIDSTLTLVMLLGAWAVLRAAETGRLRWLLLSALAVGLGFNIKMLESYLVVPAFGLLYLLAAPHSIGKRILHLLLAGVVMAVLSLSWLVAVDLTPASQRPYVGSSQTNSEIELAFGYNGASRLLGRFGGAGGFGGNGNRTRTGTDGQGTGNQNGFPGNGQGGIPGGTNGSGTPDLPPNVGQGGQFGGNGGGMFGTGNPGPLRLFESALGSQIAWLLPAAILGALALAFQRRLRFQGDRQQQALVLWGMWLLTEGIFFSVAGFFHQYYMTTMAPAICALFGIGLVVMWKDFRASGWRGWLLPLALALTAVEQIYILQSYPSWSQFLTPLIAVLSIVTLGVLLAYRLAPRIRVQAPNVRVLSLVLALGVLVLLITPTIWAAIPVIQNTASQLPVAGPSQGNDFARNAGGPAGGDGVSTSDQALISYLVAHQGNAKYLVATPSSNTANSIILSTNKAVMAMGGFSGSDPILTTSQLSSLVKNGTVRFFLLSSGRGGSLPEQILEDLPSQLRERLESGNFGGFGGARSGSATTWVTQHCTLVPSSAWSTNSSARSQLYDCSTTH